MNYRPIHLFVAIIYMILAGSIHCHAQAITLFPTTAADCYRIPSILQLTDGTLVAFTDYRFGKGDTGSGRIDILYKTLGASGVWSESKMAMQGDGHKAETISYAYGDAATVTDRETGHVLLMAAAGSVSYHHSTTAQPLRIARTMGTPGCGDLIRWTAPTDETQPIYSLFPEAKRIFFGSGRICQSRQVKHGTHYRLYAALCTNLGSLVVYSDNFGICWHALGGSEARPAPDGDEPKCEELPDGSVLLSCRQSRGGQRYYNIFTYTDTHAATGSWATVATTDLPGITNGSATNGEVLIVPAVRTADGKPVHLLLQSVPTNKRNNVTIYYKQIASRDTYASPAILATGWEGSYQVSQTSSAYSTMIQTQKGDIAFLYEENEKHSGYDIQYQQLSLPTITGQAYRFRP